MKSAILGILTILLAVAGCARHVEAPKSISMTGDDFMKFSVMSFEVNAGQPVTVTLKNVGELPKEAMAHNWVLLGKQADIRRLLEGGVSHPETDYIGISDTWQVLAKTKILGPGESDTVKFIAPSEPGRYDYVCTFPEHYAGGMKGVMTVNP